MSAETPTGQPREPWAWSEAHIRSIVGQVRAGRRLPSHQNQPDHRVTVALSFDSDHETIPLRDNITTPGQLAQGEYGSRVGAPRILALLEQFHVPATFFMPAVSAILHPEEARQYADGHEIALHGWIHERTTLLPPETERELALRARDTLERITGVSPVGIRTPSWDFSPATLAITRELGLTYDSSLMGDDEPYELVAEGSATGLIEIPVEWIRDDAPYFTMDRFGSARPLLSPTDVLGIWIAEFDRAWDEGSSLFQLTLHPHIIGHRSRIVILKQLLEHITSRSGVRFATHAEVATAARTALTGADAESKNIYE